jgi:hypothetical protein
MNFNFLSNLNYIAITVSSVVYFVIGYVWCSHLFRDPLNEEQRRHNVTKVVPTQSELYTKMALTFVANFITAFAMACLVYKVGSSNVVSGICLGLTAAVGFAATTLATFSIWENRSVRLFLLDIGYPVLGIVTSAVILSLWR